MSGCPTTPTSTPPTKQRSRSRTIIREQAAAYGKEHPEKDGSPTQILNYVTTWVGGGGPRFWFSVSPAGQAAQLRAGAGSAHRQRAHARLCQPGAARALARSSRRSLRLPSIADESHQLPGGNSRRQPGRCRHQAERAGHRRLRRIAGQVSRHPPVSAPGATRLRNEWENGKPAGQAQHRSRPRQSRRHHQPRRRQLRHRRAQRRAGHDAAGRRSQYPGRRAPPLDERAQLSDVQNLYVYSSSQNGTKVPLVQVSDVSNEHDDRTHRRASITSAPCRSTAFPAAGHLAVGDHQATRCPKSPSCSRRIAARLRDHHRRRVRQAARRLRATWRRCWRISILAIYLALLFQFNNAVKPLLVFAATPYGVVGAHPGLWRDGALRSASWPFSASASLIGVIVSHVIVLFDFIEEMHAQGRALRAKP